jgi:hypothetical protein
MFGHLRDQAGQHAEHDEHDRLGHLKPGGDHPADDHHDGDGHAQREKLLLPSPTSGPYHRDLLLSREWDGQPPPNNRRTHAPPLP